LDLDKNNTASSKSENNIFGFTSIGISGIITPTEALQNESSKSN
jgi:hypothetical protein